MHGPRRTAPYHRRVLSPALLALVLVLFVILLAPAGRLRRSGWPAGTASTYLVVMILLGVFAAEQPGPARFLVPILILAYLTPFVLARLGFDGPRIQRRPVVTVEPPEIKQVHGPARDVPPDRPRSSVDADDDRSSRTP
jgi:hypothetical protein